MAKIFDRMMLLATTAAHDAEPAEPAAADQIVASNVAIEPVRADTVSQALAREHYGASPDTHYDVYQRIAFDVGYAGAGVPGGGERARAPQWGGLIQACGMRQSPVAAPADWSATTEYALGDRVKHEGVTWRSKVYENRGNAPQDGRHWEAVVEAVAYTPVTGNGHLATLWLYIHDVLHKLEKARGTWTLNFAQGKEPQLRFEFTARYVDPSDATNPTPDPDVPVFPNPVIPSQEDTLTLLLHGVGVNNGHAEPAGFDPRFHLHTLSLRYGARVRSGDLSGGAAAVQIVDRTPSGQFEFQAPAVANLALVNKAAAGATGPFRLSHADDAGNTVTLDMPAVQLSSPSYRDDEGYWHIRTGFKALPEAGNDEIRLTVS